MKKVKKSIDHSLLITIGIIFVLLVLPITVGFLQKQQQTQELAATSQPTPNGITGSWNLVFDDEFNGTSLNTKYWAPSWFNGGKINSNGTTLNPSNVSVSGGQLHLTLASNSSGATINSDPSQVSGGGYQFGTGYVVEARIYIPGSGTAPYNWPAFWTDGQSWPTDGESDIFEGLGAATSNYHSPQGANNSGTIAGNWVNAWHTYALDREQGTDYIYWDGKLVRQYNSDDGGSPQYILLTVDCSGGCTTGAASTMNVDYVRVWQKCSTNCSPTVAVPSGSSPAPTTISPTFGTIGDCQTQGTCPTVSPTSGQTTPITTIPSSTISNTPSGSPSQAPSTMPSTTISTFPTLTPISNPGNGNGNLLQLLLQFILQLLQLLSQLFGKR